MLPRALDEHLLKIIEGSIFERATIDVSTIKMFADLSCVDAE